MFNISTNDFLKLTFLITLSLLITVYVMQYGFNILPCKLCVFQRFPYFAIVTLLGLYFVVGNKYNPQTILNIVTLLFIVSSGLSLYHSLIEFKIIETEMQCAELHNFNSTESIYNNLIGKKAISCDMATFKIFNLSLSNWNFLVSFIMLIFSIILIYKNK